MLKHTSNLAQCCGQIGLLGAESSHIWMSQEVRNHAGCAPRIDLESGVGATRVSNNVLCCHAPIFWLHEPMGIRYANQEVTQRR